MVCHKVPKAADIFNADNYQQLDKLNNTLQLRSDVVIRKEILLHQ